LLFGIVPAMRAGRGDLSLRLRSGGRGSSAARKERRVSDLLMVAEIAFSLVLLVAAGMLTRAFLKLVHTDPGFRPEQAIVVRLVIPTHRYGAYEEGGSNVSRRTLYKRLKESTRSIAGVEVSALTVKVPIAQFWNPDGFSIDGRPPAIQNDSPIMLERWGIPMHGMVSYQTVSPEYFPVLGIPIVRGRPFDGRDRAGTPFSAIVNQALVRKFFANEDPIGHRIAVDRGTDFLRRMTIVGVAADARLDGVDQQAQPEVFASMDQLPAADTWIVARARGDANSIASALRKAVHDVDPELGLVQLETMKGMVSDSLWRERFSALLVGLFAGIAALMAGGGLYAVISQAVEQRSQEVGVRLALGASASQIARTVLGHGFRVTAVGMTVGTVFTLMAGRLLAHEAYPIAELPWIFGVVASFLLFLTVLAGWVPLRRALAVDPVTALRSE
jgi:predicted permease